MNTPPLFSFLSFLGFRFVSRPLGERYSWMIIVLSPTFTSALFYVQLHHFLDSLASAFNIYGYANLISSGTATLQKRETILDFNSIFFV